MGCVVVVVVVSTKTKGVHHTHIHTHIHTHTYTHIHPAIYTPPHVPSVCTYTQAMRDIVAKCLVKDPSKRPTASQLLEHKFFKVWWWWGSKSV